MPNWLPAMVSVNPWSNDTYDKLYRIFCQDIRDNNLFYLAYKVWTFPEKEDGKERIFWHLTTRDVKSKKIHRKKQKYCVVSQKERLPDIYRCERLPWVKALIENPSELEVLTWDYKEGNNSINTYIWLKEHNFVVIMKKYEDGTRRIITSFYVDKLYTKQDFERKYKNRIL